jgi:hypothetical protein
MGFIFTPRDGEAEPRLIELKTSPLSNFILERILIKEAVHHGVCNLPGKHVSL